MANLYQRMLGRNENAAFALQQASQDLRNMTAGQIIARLDAERPGIEAIKCKSEAENDAESYVAAVSALGYLNSERKKLAGHPAAAKPFDHPYFWAAFGVHGAVASVSSPLMPN